MGNYNDETGEYESYDPLKTKYKEIWLEALRNEGFKQGDGFLKRLDDSQRKPRYCCLGVIAEKCEVLKENNKVGSIIYWSNEEDQGNLSPDFCKKIGLDVDAAATLVELNDGGKSFKFIANWIEGNL